MNMDAQGAGPPLTIPRTIRLVAAKSVPGNRPKATPRNHKPSMLLLRYYTKGSVLWARLSWATVFSWAEAQGCFRGMLFPDVRFDRFHRKLAATLRGKNLS